MSLQSRIASLITAIGTAIKADRTRLTALEGRFVITGSVGDNGVVAVPVPTIGGFATITLNPNANVPAIGSSGFVQYRAGPSSRAVTLVYAGSASFAVTNSEPTGTTGTDGRVTVGVKQNFLVIENRSGGAAPFLVCFS